MLEDDVSTDSKQLHGSSAPINKVTNTKEASTVDSIGSGRRPRAMAISSKALKVAVRYNYNSATAARREATYLANKKTSKR